MSAAGARWRLALGFLSGTGRVREANEDALEVFVPVPEGRTSAPLEGFFAVADGMGGHVGGAEASRTAVDRARREYLAWRGEDLGAGEWIERLFTSINEELREQSSARGIPRGMGSTLTVAIVRGDRLFLGHIGDSRCYRLRNGELEQLTDDHSWVAEQRRAGLLSADEEHSHVDRHVLLRCLGIDDEVVVDVREETVALGDRYLLTSDGVHGAIEPASLARVLAEEPDPQAAARRLLELAEEHGGHDNETALVFDVRPAAADTEAITIEEELPGGPALARAGRGPDRLLVAGGLLALAIGVGSGAWSYSLRDRAEREPAATAAADSASAAPTDSTIRTTETPRPGDREAVPPGASSSASSDTTGGAPSHTRHEEGSE